VKNSFFLIVINFFALLSFGQKSLQIYGGEDHDIYLGCLNCNDVASNSIWNDVGKYGSNVSSLSIWNDVGRYGSDVSSYSPWNDYASYPPVIVDNDGGFYGYFTINESKSKRAEFDLVGTLYKYHDFIKDDVGKWYKKIFE
jgi:hypothetical protein